MAETEKVPVEVGEKEMEQPAASREWRVLQNVRKEIDRLFEDFNLRSWRLPFARAPGEIEPLWRSDTSWGSAPFVDVVDKEHGYEITAEMPGMDPSNISVKFSTGTLTIKGEKKEEKEEKGKDYVLSERRWGSFQRSFRVPASIDEEKIEATFSNGVLTIVLPKSAEAQYADEPARPVARLRPEGRSHDTEPVRRADRDLTFRDLAEGLRRFKPGRAVYFRKLRETSGLRRPFHPERIALERCRVDVAPRRPKWRGASRSVVLEQAHGVKVPPKYRGPGPPHIHERR